MMDNNLPKAFIFDLDGVLTDTAEYHFLAWKQLSDKLELKFDKSVNERLKGISRLDSFNEILAFNNKVYDFSMEEKLKYCEVKNDIYVQLIKNITKNDLLPKIYELLLAAKENGIKTAVASVSRNAFTVISSLEIGHLLDYICDAKTVKNTKPHPEVFLNCANYLNVPPHCCIGFEDADAGIIAIKNAKMFAVGINVAKQGMHNFSPDLSLESTSELDFNLIVDEFKKYQQR